jgi:ketosteroid isomerase-like protein
VLGAGREGEGVTLFEGDLLPRDGEQAVSERETIVFRRDGKRWTAVHEHLPPRPEPVA